MIHTNDISSSDYLKLFTEEFSVNRIFSTSATIVNYGGALYNVDGSSRDPHIDGYNWKSLLISYGINQPCYATAPVAPPGNTHPQFSVGGHVTPNQDGSVAIGGICYLMPLCSWHNSKSRDGYRFNQINTKMLRLTGYMQNELVESFQARMSEDAPYSLLYATVDGLGFRYLAEAEAKVAGRAKIFEGLEADASLPHILLRRHSDADGDYYTVEDAKF